MSQNLPPEKRPETASQYEDLKRNLVPILSI